MLLLSYQCLSYLAMPFFVGYLFRKRIQHDGYTKHLSQRFGFPTIRPNRPIWIHGVSVGESVIACQVANAILKKDPKKAIIITTHTPTGRDYVRENAPDGVAHTYVPFDAPFCVKRFLRIIKPSKLLLIETEIWPNILHYTAKIGCPIFIINARLSAPAYRQYRWLTPLFKQLMPNVTQVLAQSLTDAARYKRIGTPKKKLTLLGNIKADAMPPEDALTIGQKHRQAWGETRLVCIGASTHDQEETFVIEAFETLRKTHPDALLVLAPRHPNRSETIGELCVQHKLRFAYRTEWQKEPIDVLIINVIGEMWHFYAAADLTFVGGTVIRLGGHNPLEPAKLHKPVASGPYVFNATDAYLALRKGGGGIIVRTSEALAKHWLTLANDTTLRQQWGEAAWTSIAPMTGVLKRTMAAIFDVSRETI